MFILEKTPFPECSGDTRPYRQLSVNDISLSIRFRSGLLQPAGQLALRRQAGLQQSIPGNFQELAIVRRMPAIPLRPICLENR